MAWMSLLWNRRANLPRSMLWRMGPLWVFLHLFCYYVLSLETIVRRNDKYSTKILDTITWGRCSTIEWNIYIYGKKDHAQDNLDPTSWDGLHKSFSAILLNPNHICIFSCRIINWFEFSLTYACSVWKHLFWLPLPDSTKDMVAYDSIDSICSLVHIPDVWAKKANTAG